MHIIPLTLEDCGQAALLHQAAFFKGWSEKDFREFLKNPLVHGLKTEENHGFSGFILWREVEDEAEILTFVIVPSYQRKGRGSLLLTTLTEILMQKHIQNLFLEVAEDNDQAQVFYRKHNFVLLSKRLHYYPRQEGQLIPAFIFFKKLV
jgi:[ribosomal protein S18]-alanine N-acetyltransferase